MAGWLNAHKTLRVLHLYLSLAIFFMALLYIVTGFVMTQYKWIKSGEEKVEKTVLALNYLPDTTRPDQFAKEIKQQFDISGRMNYSRNGKKQLQFMFIRPGERVRVVVHHALDSVSITRTTKKSLQEISTRVHRLHGFEGGALYMAWAILLDITAVAMLLFVVTGILIWVQYKNMRFWGGVILIATVLIGIGMFLYLR